MFIHSGNSAISCSYLFARPLATPSQILSAKSPGGVRLVHRRDLSGDGGPFQFPSHCLASFLLADLVPFQQLVCKPQVRLYDHIQSTGPYVAVRSREGKPEAGHDFSDANGCRSRHTYTTVYERGGSVGFALT